MLVAVTGFGSVWRRRFAKDRNDSKRFVRAAYFNTTGVPVNGIIRTRPKIAGHVRFNAVGGFDPNRLLAMINKVFECAESCLWNGQNKVMATPCRWNDDGDRQESSGPKALRG